MRIRESITPAAAWDGLEGSSMLLIDEVRVAILVRYQSKVKEARTCRRLGHREAARRAIGQALRCREGYWRVLLGH